MKDSSSPRLDAELLLAHTLGLRRLDLYLKPERALRPEEASSFERLLAARQAGAPVAYLIGRKEFMGLDLEVTPDVLIPRPETERLVEVAVEWARRRHPDRAADIGTGSGAVALALAHDLPDLQMEATDISAAALKVAARNADRLGLQSRIRWSLGDVTDPLTAPVDLLVANLPYIADAEWDRLPVSVRAYEPPLALRGGADGLDVYRRLLERLPGRLKPQAFLALEIDPGQWPGLRALVAERLRPREIDIVTDLGGRERVLVARC